eukprot:16426936-Heterocapsa_arctica.AAC.2
MEDRENGIEEESDAMDVVRQSVVRHVAPSVQVGMGKARSTLALKLHAITHALRLLTHDLPALHKLFRSIVTWLSDQGVEAGLARVRPIPLLRLVPPKDEADAQPPPPLAEVDLAPGPE